MKYIVENKQKWQKMLFPTLEDHIKKAEQILSDNEPLGFQGEDAFKFYLDSNTFNYRKPHMMRISNKLTRSICGVLHEYKYLPRQTRERLENEWLDMLIRMTWVQHLEVYLQSKEGKN